MTTSKETRQAVFSQIADSLIVSDSSLNKVMELLSHAEETVHRTKGFNLQSTTLQRLQVMRCLYHSFLMYNVRFCSFILMFSSLFVHRSQHLQTQLEKKQSTLLPVTEMTKDVLQYITNIFSALQEIKKVSRHLFNKMIAVDKFEAVSFFLLCKLQEFENQAAQLDGAKWELFKTLNKMFQMMAKVDIVTEAEEHAEELSRAAAAFQQ